MVRNGYEARYKYQAQGIAKAKAEGKYRCHRVNESLQALGIVTHRYSRSRAIIAGVVKDSLFDRCNILKIIVFLIYSQESPTGRDQVVPSRALLNLR